MDKFKSQIPRIVVLADQLEASIRKRGLNPGDPFLSTLETSKLLGVGNGIANRALQLLEKRNVIVRQRRKGSFVASKSVSQFPASLNRIHLLVHQYYFQMEGVANDGVLLGIQGELPTTSISISFLPQAAEAEFVDKLIANSLNGNERDGFVMIRASLETQRHIAASGLPALVAGSVYPSVEGLARIDRDHSEVGRLLTEYLLDQGHKRIVCIMRQNILPGDFETLDAIQATMGKRGFGINDFVIRSLPPDGAAAEALALQLLESSDKSTGFICRNANLANGVVSAVLARSPKGKTAKCVNSQVAVCDYFPQAGDKLQYVFPRPTLSPEEQGRCIGRLLRRQANGEELNGVHEVIPVGLVIPDEK